MIIDEASARAFVAARGDKDTMNRLDVLERRLRAENDRQNLISRGTLGHVWQRHIADSAQLLDLVPRETQRPWLDLGTGGGFPGLVVAAMRPSLEVVLVESRRKRIDWLARMIDELELPRCHVEGVDVSKIDPFPAGVISARAFAPLPKLLEVAGRFSTNDTVWLLPKGRSAEQELSALPIDVQTMFHVEQSATDPEARILVGKKAKNA